MKPDRLRKCLSASLSAAVFLGLGVLSVGSVSAAAGAPSGGTVVPVLVDLADVQQGGQVQAQGSTPFRHPGGQVKLDQLKAEAQSQATSAGIQVGAAAPAAPGALAPTPGLGFDGISSAESFCNCLPPDGAIGVGPNHVVAAVNTSFKIWNKQTGLAAGPATSLISLFSHHPACLSNVSDPAAQYDAAFGGHYVLEGLTYDAFFNSSICIAVSLTSDPTGLYWVYGFTVSPAFNLLDFPQMAIGSDAIYLAGNQFTFGSSFNGARVYAYSKSNTFKGEPAAWRFQNVGNNAAGKIADSLYPAKGVTAANTGYFLGAENNGATGNNISLWKWFDPFGANQFTLRGGVTVTTYSQPPKAIQKGGTTTDTLDVRNLGAAYYQGTVYGAHTTGCNPGGGAVPCVQWYQLGSVDSTAPTLIQQGILGGIGESRYLPNLSADRLGDMVLGYAYASTTEYPGVRYTGRLASDTLNTLQPEAVWKAGEGVIDGSRYGDYAGQQVDTDGCTVWHLEEYAKLGALWGTWIGSTKFTGCGAPPTPDFSLSATPASATVVQGASASYTVNIARTGFTGAVTFSASGMPGGASASFNPASTTGISSVMTVTTTSATPTGTFTLTITGTGGTPSLTRTTTVTLVVQPAAASDFSLSATPASATVVQGASANYTVNITRTGFTGAVTFSASGMPGGASASFNPASTTGISSVMTVTTTSATPTGTFTLTITGTGGTPSLTRTTTVTLVVQPAAVSDFSLSATPASATVIQGASANYTVNITRTGFTGAVTFSASGMPGGASASFNPASTTGISSVMTVTTTSATTTGTFTLTITGTGGTPSLTRTTTVTLVITPGCINGDGDC